MTQAVPLILGVSKPVFNELTDLLCLQLKCLDFKIWQFCVHGNDDRTDYFTLCTCAGGNEQLGGVLYGNTYEIRREICIFMTVNHVGTCSFPFGYTHLKVIISHTCRRGKAIGSVRLCQHKNCHIWRSMRHYKIQVSLQRREGGKTHLL